MILAKLGKCLPIFFFFFFGYLFICLVALGRPCCSLAFSSCCKWGLLFVAVSKLLIVAASLVAENKFRGRGFGSRSTWAQ